jgi:hypothetical protein
MLAPSPDSFNYPTEREGDQRINRRISRAGPTRLTGSRAYRRVGVNEAPFGRSVAARGSPNHTEFLTVPPLVPRGAYSSPGSLPNLFSIVVLAPWSIRMLSIRLRVIDAWRFRGHYVVECIADCV